MSDLTTSVSASYSIGWGIYWTFQLEFPDFCPHCNEKGRPNFLLARYKTSPEILIHSSFECNNMKCKKLFLTDYKIHNWNPILSKIYPKTPEAKVFSNIILDISSQFCSIFNQAFLAENYWLDQIAWVWYRKALEFLIKDYLIKNKPESKIDIEKLQLSPCIQKYISNEKIKLVSERAVWLWNDETHYVKKWENKDIEDLKKLIELTVHWIQMEIQTDELLVDMP